MNEYIFSDKAMGTEYDISINATSLGIANKNFAFAKDTILKYESIFSRFDKDSELYKLNSVKEMYVSEIFAEVLEEAFNLYRITGGFFNPLFQIEQLGYDKDFDQIKNINNQKIYSEYDFDMDKIIFDKSTRLVKLEEAQKLDFGGFLKGYLAEKICKIIKNSSTEILGVIVNIGGDLHTQGFDLNNEKFIFEIENPINENAPIEIEIQNMSLATSGTYKRKWLNNNVSVNHILDRTGAKNPESDIISASVIIEKGSESEAYSKLIFIDENALTILNDKKIKYVIIKSNGQIIKN